METVVGIEDNDDGKLGDSGVDRNGSALSSSKQIANPVIYKLVRVKGDGSLVPATDDEVMEVEDFLNYNSEMCAVEGTEQSVNCTSIERSSSGKLRLECSEGLSNSDTAVAARLQYIEQMLQKVKEEEKLHLARRSPVHSYLNISSPCSANNLSAVDGKMQSDSPMQRIGPYLPLSLNNSRSNQSGSIGQCPNPSEELIESGSSVSALCSTLKPDIFMLEGEVCLNKLSISELHELFKVTFGRETNVKDKQWLKRRISRGLTNSSDVSTSTFIVRDDKLVDKLEEDSCGNVSALLLKGTTDGEEDINVKDSSTAKGNEIEDNQFVSGKRHRNHDMEHELGSGDHHTEQRATKRIQKLTKRCVEELSENESRDHNQRVLSLYKNMIFECVSSNSYIRPARNSFAQGRTVVTRLDSLGGSEIHIPCVSRVRKGRPRKNILSLMNFLPIGTGEAEKLASKGCGVHGSQTDSGSQDTVLKSRSTPGKLQQPSTAEAGKRQQYSVIGTKLQQDLRHKKVDRSNYTSDDNIVTVPTTKGGTRRKHHRAWTITEVLKLVEGVSRCGPGRWSEIKRLAFASYSYRTSVDLKDKWRNLLKASFAQAPADEGIHYSRKHVPIPEAILVRVRELAVMNSQVPPNFTSSNQVAGAETIRQDRSSEYL